ncbi:MAG: DUF2269 family protein [Actinomycetota bacterium]|nr:DUF2269 family protein [Actinomycetota bacterium]
MSTYDWLLFLHLLGAVAVFAAIATYSAVLMEAGRPATAASFLPLIRVGGVLFDVGGLLLIVFGIWLAFDADYGLTDEWVVAALVMYAAAAYAGTRTRIRLLAARSAASDRPLRDAVREARAVPMYLVMVVTVLVLLALMIFKPGAG